MTNHVSPILLPQLTAPVTQYPIPSIPTTLSNIDSFHSGIQSCLFDIQNREAAMLSNINASISLSSTNMSLMATSVNKTVDDVENLLSKIEALEMTVDAQNEIINKLVSRLDAMEKASSEKSATEDAKKLEKIALLKRKLHEDAVVQDNRMRQIDAIVDRANGGHSFSGGFVG